MKRALVFALGLLALAASIPASAADLPRGMPYKSQAYLPSAYNWTGFYLGINGGGAWGDSTFNTLGIGVSPSGGMIGLTAGYNWQGLGNPWVFGLEGDIDWASISDSTACVVATVVCKVENNWFGTLRGRVGYSWDRFLPYITGGAAFGNIKTSVTGFTGVNDSNVGWTIGAGVEGVIAGNWTGKIEYLYADLGDINCTALTCIAASTVDLQLNILRAGVNYRF